MFSHKMKFQHSLAVRISLCLKRLPGTMQTLVLGRYLTFLRWFPTYPNRADSQILRNGLPLLGKASGPSRRALSWVTFDHLLRQWGTPELAERAAHDLFFNVRSLSPPLSRLRLFGSFIGCLPPLEIRGPSHEVCWLFYSFEWMAIVIMHVEDILKLVGVVSKLYL